MQNLAQLKNDLSSKGGNTLYNLQKDIRIAKFLIFTFSLATCIIVVFKYFNGTLAEDKWFVFGFWAFFMLFFVQSLYYAKRSLKWYEKYKD